MMKMNEKIDTEKCCVVTYNTDLSETYWNNQYNAQTTRWDLGEVSPPIKEYINQLENKNLRILIPGCGNTYEAEYLLQQGFSDITIIDIAPTLVENLKLKFEGNKNINIILGDFFKHEGKYDLILEQTFFCALNPALRNAYVAKMKTLLINNGKLAGVLFGVTFAAGGPPFGGSKCQYISLFENDFNFNILETCYNSFTKRQDSELFFVFSVK